MAQRVDFTSEAFFRDPAATVARLRAIGPAVETRFPIVGKVWVTTTYEATAQVQALERIGPVHAVTGRC